MPGLMRAANGSGAAATVRVHRSGRGASWGAPYVGSYVVVRNMPTMAVDPSGEILFVLGVGAAVGAAVSTGMYVATNCGNVTAAGAAGAAVAGAIAGATTAIGGPVGGTVVRAFAGSSRLAAFSATGIFNFGGGMAATSGGSIASGHGLPSRQQLAAGGLLNTAAGYVGGWTAPYRNVSTLSQATRFMPRTRVSCRAVGAASSVSGSQTRGRCGCRFRRPPVPLLGSWKVTRPRRRGYRIELALATLGLLYIAYAGVLTVWGAGHLVRQLEYGGDDIATAILSLTAGCIFIVATRGLWEARSWSFPLALMATLIFVVVSGRFAIPILRDGLAGLAFGTFVLLLALGATVLTVLARAHLQLRH